MVVAAVVLGALLVLVLALIIGDGRPKAAPVGVPDPGPLTGWGLPISRLAMDLCAIGALGSLLYAVVLAPSRKEELEGTAARATRVAANFAWGWLAATVVLLLLTVSDFMAAPIGSAGFTTAITSVIVETSQGRGLGLVAILVLIVASSARGIKTLNGAGLLLVLALAALLPPALTGHSADAANHDIATSSLLVHIVAATVWVGGLLAVIVFARKASDVLQTAAKRFSALALWCFIATGASGVVNAWVRLDAIPQLWESRYGWLVVGKSLALIGLGAFGFWHRRRTLVALEASKAGAFRRLALVEVAVMAGAVALAVALARTPTPVPEERSLSWSPGEAIIGRDLPPVTFDRLLTLWRLDIVVLALAATALVLYFMGVVRLVRRGDKWPVGRSVALVCAVLLGTVVLTGGVATYAPALFSAHMVQHMTLTMLVPILLAMSAPITLALRALPARGRSGGRGPREWILLLLHSRIARVLTHPVVALSLYILTLYGFYFSPLFETAMRSHAAHLVMHAHFLLVGSLYFWPIIGLDPMPRRLPPMGRMLMLFASIPFHAFFGVIVMSSSTLIGGSWYRALALPWADPIADQNLGGGIAWAAAEIPTLIVLGVVFVQWLRSDERAAARADKHGAADLAAYNARLAALAEHDRRTASG